MARRGRPREREGERPEIGERLRQTRARLGITQRQAAEVLGVHAVTLARWETGQHVPRGLAQRYLERWMDEALASAEEGDDGEEEA